VLRGQEVMTFEINIRRDGRKDRARKYERRRMNSSKGNEEMDIKRETKNNICCLFIGVFVAGEHLKGSRFARNIRTYEGGTRTCRKLHVEKIYSLFSSLNIIRVI
jgi:hypothetical protein